MTHHPAPVAMPAESFGARLRALREEVGLTQEALAERAGITSYAVSALERGRRLRPYPHTVRCLADALGADERQRAQLLSAVPRRPATIDLRAGAAPETPVPTTPGTGPTTHPAPAAAGGTGLPHRVPLPAAATPLLGRDGDVAALVDLLVGGRSRLLTLTGTGGVGKTRLATAVAAQVADAFPDGTALVALAPLSDPCDVLPAIARAVGCGTLEGPDTARLLAEHLRPLQVLVVLDNVEHLLEAAEHLAELVAQCPRLVLLVTSRAPLRVRGETEYPVQPLAVPAEGVDDPADLAACAAVAVFVDRARAVSLGFEVLPDNAQAVAALCRRLAGIPLALELAAARVRFLSPQALLARLDDAMERAGGPDLPARQRTLRATFDWSYDLLTTQERRLLRVLSVFAGGCTLEALEDVSAALGEGEPVMPLLEVLVEHSLVVVAPDEEGEPRFGLLEPVAQYARRRQEPDERARLQAAHAAHFLAWAERAGPEYQAGDQVRWLDRSEREDANLTAAATFALSAGDGETLARLCWAQWLFWWLRGRLLAGRRLAEAALPLPMPHVVRTRAMLTAACMAFALDDHDVAGRRWREAEELAARGPDLVARGQSAAGVALVALAAGDLDGAEQRFRAALPFLQGTDVYSDWLHSLVQVWLGTVHTVRGDLAGAVGPMRAGLASARARGDRLTAYVALYNLSQVAIAMGEHEVAREHLLEGMRLTQETGDLANLGYLLEALAVVEGATGHAHRAAVLLGAAESVREVTGTHVYGYYKPDPDLLRQCAEQARAVLGDDVYGDSQDAGRTLSADEAVTYAMTAASR